MTHGTRYEVFDRQAKLAQMKTYTNRRDAEDAAKLLNFQMDGGPKGRCIVQEAAA